eukprot:gene11357-62800_t
MEGAYEPCDAACDCLDGGLWVPEGEEFVPCSPVPDGVVPP